MDWGNINRKIYFDFTFEAWERVEQNHFLLYIRSLIEKYFFVFSKRPKEIKFACINLSGRGVIWKEIENVRLEWEKVTQGKIINKARNKYQSCRSFFLFFCLCFLFMGHFMNTNYSQKAQIFVLLCMENFSKLLVVGFFPTFNFICVISLAFFSFKKKIYKTRL